MLVKREGNLIPGSRDKGTRNKEILSATVMMQSCSRSNRVYTSLFAGNSIKEIPWGALDDVVMGGVSESSFQIDMNGGEAGGPTGVFKGFFL